MLNNDTNLWMKIHKKLTYKIKRETETEINPIFDSEDVLALLNEFPVIKLININKGYNNSL